MVDVTGGTPPIGSSPFRVPEDIKAVYDHFGDPAMFEVANAAVLPMEGNWVGRRLSVADTGVVYRWGGSGWAPATRSAHAGKIDGFQNVSGGKFITLALQSQYGGFTLAGSGTSLMFPTAGEYRVAARIYLSGAGSGTVAVAVHQAGVSASVIMGVPVFKESGNDAERTVWFTRQFPAGSGVRLWASFPNSAWGSTGYDGSYLEAELIR